MEPPLQSSSLFLLFTEQCEARGLVYSACGKTCDNFMLNDADLRCTSGCFCQEGKVLHENGTCVEPTTECQCKEADRYFNKGEISPSDCSKYVLPTLFL